MARVKERANTKYEDLLREFGAENKPNRESVKYLESLGFRSGQARSAVYQYRKSKGLVRERSDQVQSE